MKSKKNRKYTLDEDITTTGLASSDFGRFESGAQDSEIIKAINESTEPVVFFTGNAKHFKHLLNRDHQAIRVSKKLPKNKMDQYVTEAQKFLKRKTGTKKYPYLLLTSDHNSELVLQANPGTKEVRTFKIL